MARVGKPAAAKRERERAKRAKRAEKQARRAKRKEEKAAGIGSSAGETSEEEVIVDREDGSGSSEDSAAPRPDAAP